jgi:hypothetical protein
MHIHITKHAMDRISQRLLEVWLAECPERTPGLVTWAEGLVRSGMRGGLPPANRYGIVQILTPRGCFVAMVRKGVEKERFLSIKTFSPDPGKRPSNNGTRAPRACRLCGEAGCECEVER